MCASVRLSYTFRRNFCPVGYRKFNKSLKIELNVSVTIFHVCVVCVCLGSQARVLLLNTLCFYLTQLSKQ